MRITCPLVIVAVLICSTAVSSTTSGVSDENDCNNDSLCNNMSNQDKLERNPSSEDDQDSERRMQDSDVLQPDQLSCSTCNLLSLIMKERFESTKREDMLERMLLTCYSLHSLSDTCANIVFNYFDDVYELVKDQLQSNEICALSGICADDNWKIQSEGMVVQKKHDEFYCVECKQIVKHLHESLMKDMTEAQFKKKLSSSCLLTRNFKTECIRVVDQYSHVIYTMLKINLKADDVCLFIGVCHKKKELDADLIDLGNELQVSLDSDEDPQLPQCFLCKNAFRIVKRLVSKHASNDKVKNAMNHACDKLGKVANKCHDFVNKHGNGIIRFVRNPRVICSMLAMCFPIGHETVEYEVVDAINAEQVQMEVPRLEYSDDVQLITETLTKESKYCHLCTTIIKTLQNLFKNHHDINNALKDVCLVWKEQNLKDKCEDMINKHTDLIIDLVSKNVAHQQICRSLNMCLLLEQENEVVEEEAMLPELQSDKFDLEMPQPVTQVFSKGVPKCSMCNTVIRNLLRMVHHGGKEEIKNALGHVCQKLRKLQEACEEMVNKHSDQIIDLITKHTPANRICKIMGICHKYISEEDFDIDETETEMETMTEEQNNQLVVDLQITASPKCFVCKKAMKVLQHMIQHHGDRGSIQRAMQKVCSKLGKLSGKCDRMIQRHGNKIVDLMTKHVAVQQICKLIGVCKKSVSLEDSDIDEELTGEPFAELSPVNSICAIWELIASDAIVENMQSSNELEGPTDANLGPFCIICELLVAKFKSTLDTKAKRDNLLHSIIFTCDHLPHFIGQPCHAIVQSYGSAVLDLISKVTPHEVCHILQTNANQTSSDNPSFLQEFGKTLNEFLDTNCVRST